MHIGIYPVFDKRFAGAFSAGSGVVLLDETATLEATAARRGNPTLESFHAYIHVEVPPDYEGDPHDLWFLHDPKWHDPAAGVAAVELLTGAVLCDRPEFQRHALPRVVEALEELRIALAAAVQAGARFNLQVFQQ
jgi:hypothetical protein